MAEAVEALFRRGDAATDLRGALAAKRGRLEEILRGMGRVVVAYSGGVDSAVLLAEAHRVLGSGARGVIADSPSLPRAELDAALGLALDRGIAVEVVRTEELARPEYRANGSDRCYHCKHELFERLGGLVAGEAGTSLAYGAVTDDLGEVRPGMAAAERARRSWKRGSPRSRSARWLGKSASGCGTSPSRLAWPPEFPTARKSPR